MRTKRTPLALALSLVIALAAMNAAAVMQVGFAVRYTTSAGSFSDICLGGYGVCFCRRANGVNDPIYARTIVIRNTTSRTTVAIVSLDAIGASNRVIKSILPKVNSPRTLIPANHIIVAEMHSHGTPDLVGLWGGVSDVYKAFGYLDLRRRRVSIVGIITRSLLALLH